MSLVKSKVFETMVLWHPTADQFKNGQKSKIIVELKTTLEPDEKSAGMKAIKSIPDEFNDQLEQIEVVVKPF